MYLIAKAWRSIMVLELFALEATRAKLPAHFLCRKLDLVKVKGKEEAVWVYDTWL